MVIRICPHNARIRGGRSSGALFGMPLQPLVLFFPFCCDERDGRGGSVALSLYGSPLTLEPENQQSPTRKVYNTVN